MGLGKTVKTTKQTKDQLWKALQPGRANAMATKAILRAMGLPVPDGKTNLGILFRVMLDEGYCIGSCPKGHFRISNESELEAAKQEIRNQIAGLNRRMRLLQSAWENGGSPPVQKEMFP